MVGQWRRFERTADGRTEYREVRQEGIRCLLRWGAVGGSGRAMTVTRDDVADAGRHAARKAREYLRKGFAEVEAGGGGPAEGSVDGSIDPSTDGVAGGPAEARPGAGRGVGSEAGARKGAGAGTPDGAWGGTPDEACGRTPGGAGGGSGAARPELRPVLDVLPGGDAFLPVAGFDGIHRRRRPALDPTAGFHEYLVLRDGGRGAISFNVRAASHDPEAVGAFLGFLDTRRDLPFDGGSHHKLRLTAPVGRFTHALLCSPALGRSHHAFPGIADRVASACPVFDCEIGDADTEVLADARIHGHGAVRRAEWDREPRPVVDLRFDVQPSFHAPARKKFLVCKAEDLRSLLSALPGASVESWLEVRSFRGEVRRFTPRTAPAYEDLLPFLLGAI